LAQQKFGLLSLGDGSGAFVVSAYPVSVRAWDVLLVALTVIATGWLAAWYPVRAMSRRLLR
jgi:lipoprotein-releasing system permease protein